MLLLSNKNKFKHCFRGTNGGTGRESGGTNNQTIPPVTNQPPPPAVHVPAGGDGMEHLTHSPSRGVNAIFYLHPMSENDMILTRECI